MINNYVIRRIFDDAQVDEIKSILESEPEDMWLDGLVSGGHENSKKNFEFSNQNSSYQKIREIVMSSLDSDIAFNNFTFAKSSSPIIISKYLEGGHYKVHQDNVYNGNFSTTIFLDDPVSYDGGELCLFINNREIKFKLPAGYAITYETGLFHKVSKVTRGERKAVVFWSKSDVKDRFLVYVYGEIFDIHKGLFDLLQEGKIDLQTDFEDFQSVIGNPLIRLSAVGNEILRRMV